MPTYDYECKSCGYRFEEFQKMSDEPLNTCPECGRPVRRLIGTGGGIIFKGSGFYATDYGKSSSGFAGCDKETPCCGRDIPCDKSTCDDRSG